MTFLSPNQSSSDRLDRVNQIENFCWDCVYIDIPRLTCLKMESYSRENSYCTTARDCYGRYDCSEFVPKPRPS